MAIAGGLNALRVEWKVTASYGSSVEDFNLTQMRGEWLNIFSANSDVGGLDMLDLSATCYATPASQSSSSASSMLQNTTVTTSTTTSTTITSTTTTSSTQSTAPSPRVGWTVSARNVCPFANLSVLATQPGIRVDAIVFTQSTTADVSVWSDSPYPTFQQIYGGRICVTSASTNQQWCSEGDQDFVTAQATRTGDRLDVDCPGPRPPLPDMTTTIPYTSTSKA